MSTSNDWDEVWNESVRVGDKLSARTRAWWLFDERSEVLTVEHVVLHRGLVVSRLTHAIVPDEDGRFTCNPMDYGVTHKTTPRAWAVRKAMAYADAHVQHVAEDQEAILKRATKLAREAEIET